MGYGYGWVWVWVWVCVWGWGEAGSRSWVHTLTSPGARLKCRGAVRPRSERNECKERRPGAKWVGASMVREYHRKSNGRFNGLSRYLNNPFSQSVWHQAKTRYFLFIWGYLGVELSWDKPCLVGQLDMANMWSEYVKWLFLDTFLHPDSKTVFVFEFGLLQVDPTFFSHSIFLYWIYYVNC